MLANPQTGFAAKKIQANLNYKKSTKMLAKKHLLKIVIKNCT